MDMLRRVAEDDNAVKATFDYVRNIGICGVVFAIAKWFIKQGLPLSGFSSYYSAALGVSFLFCGVILFVINYQNAQWRLAKTGDKYGKGMMFIIAIQAWLGFAVIGYLFSQLK